MNRLPTVGSFPGCCALVASGHAAAPPSTRKILAASRVQPRGETIALWEGRVASRAWLLGTPDVPSRVKLGLRVDIRRPRRGGLIDLSAASHPSP